MSDVFGGQTEKLGSGCGSEGHDCMSIEEMHVLTFESESEKEGVKTVREERCRNSWGAEDMRKIA